MAPARGPRPLHGRDLDELGASAPTSPVLVASVPDVGAKAALLAVEPDRYFTTSHFDGWSAVLVRLDRLDATSLRELAADAWAARAPRRLVADHPPRRHPRSPRSPRWTLRRRPAAVLPSPGSRAMSENRPRVVEP